MGGVGESLESWSAFAHQGSSSWPLPWVGSPVLAPGTRSIRLSFLNSVHGSLTLCRLSWLWSWSQCWVSVSPHHLQGPPCANRSTSLSSGFLTCDMRLTQQSFKLTENTHEALSSAEHVKGTWSLTPATPGFQVRHSRLFPLIESFTGTRIQQWAKLHHLCPCGQGERP